MDRFFDSTSCRDTASLAALRAILQSKQVNSDTSKNYYAISLFLDKVLDGYLQCHAQAFIEAGEMDSSKGELKFTSLCFFL